MTPTNLRITPPIRRHRRDGLDTIMLSFNAGEADLSSRSGVVSPPTPDNGLGPLQAGRPAHRLPDRGRSERLGWVEMVGRRWRPLRGLQLHRAHEVALTDGEAVMAQQ